MKRIGKPMLLRFGLMVLVILTSLPELTKAQDIEVTASVNESVVFTGERIALSVSVSGRKFKNVQAPELPDLNGLSYLSTNPSTSTSFEFINGKSSSKYTYTYFISARKEGQFTIPPITVVIDNKEYLTDPITVSVKERNRDQMQSDEMPDLFIKMEVDELKPYAGQQIIAEVVLYFKNGLDILSYKPQSGWKAEGFWKELLSDGRQPKAESVILNGVRYRRAVLMRYALFATKTGKLTLGEFEVNAAVRYASRQRDPFSSFFGGFGNNQRSVDLMAEPIELDIKPLPPIQNGIFTGAVGNFSIKRSISKTEVMVGESIDLSFTIEGDGNIALLPDFPVEHPDGFEIYEPQVSSDINRKGAVISGKKVFTEIMIPRSSGDFTIPGGDYAYFNPTNKKYVMVTLPLILLSVKRDPNKIIYSDNLPDLAVKPIYGLAAWVTTHKEIDFTSRWFQIALLIPFIAYLIAWQRIKYLKRLHGDVFFARSTRAMKKARSLLNQAEVTGEKDIKEAYSYIHKAISGYIGDKLKLPESGLSDSEYAAHIQKMNQTENACADEIKRLLETCSTIRFAPNPTSDKLNQDIAKAGELLSQLQKVLR